jgi:hypothetical protein
MAPSHLERRAGAACTGDARYDARVMRTWTFVLLAACGAPQVQTVKIINTTPRAIDELYVYPNGSADHGKSRGALAPNGSTQVQVKAGFVEVLAVSAKLQVDEHTRDRPSASQAVEVHGPVEIIFYDEEHRPPGLDRPGVFGAAFVIPKPKEPPPPGDPDAAPTP